MRLVPLECLNLLCKLRAVRVHTLALVLHPLRIFGLQLLNALRVGLLSIRFIVEVHLLLQLK